MKTRKRMTQEDAWRMRYVIAVLIGLVVSVQAFHITDIIGDILTTICCSVAIYGWRHYGRTISILDQRDKSRVHWR